MSGEGLDRRIAWFAVFFGLLTLAVFIGFFILPDVRASIASGCGNSGSLQSFQLARSVDDLIAVFSAPGGACRAPMIAAMDAADRLDLFVFIPVYGAYLACAILLFAGWKSAIARAALAFLALGLGADVLETSVQLMITPRIDRPGDLLTWLQIGAWAKYLFLSLSGVTLGLVLLKRRWPNWIVAALAFLALVSVALAFNDPARFARMMSLATALFWLALLLRVFAAALRGRALEGQVLAD
ncbi:MAG: hypothetical protein AB7J28_15245 [Hyphomonadaceae bacterium]